MILPILALVVALFSLFLAIKRRRVIKRTIESDEGFMKWRKEKREFKKLKKQLYKYQYLRDFWLPRIGTDASSLSPFRLKKITLYEEKIEYIEQKIMRRDYE